MSALEYLRQNYVVVWRHPEAVESDWKKFLIEEDHEDEEVIKTNGVFVDFAPEGSWLSVEAQERLKQSKWPNSTFQDYKITTSNIAPERIFGWDIKDYVRLMLSRKTALQMATNILWPFQQTSTNLLGTIDWQATMLKIWNEGQKFMHPEILARDDIMALMEETICAVAKEMQEFVQKEVDPLEETLIKEPKKVSDWEKKVKQCDESELQANLDEYGKALKSCLECELQKRSLVCNKVKELLEAQREGFKYFPRRTHSMVKTLQKIDLYMNLGKGNLYLIAGGSHLEERPHFDPSLFSLKELYDYIRDHKEIVILRPKIMK